MGKQVIKTIVAVGVICGLISTCGNTGVSQERYDSLLKENEELKGNNQQLSASLKQLSAEKGNYSKNIMNIKNS